MNIRKIIEEELDKLLKKEPNYNMGDYVTLEELTKENMAFVCKSMKIFGGEIKG